MRHRKIKYFLVALLPVFLLQSATAQTRTADLDVSGDSRGAPELVICSQNLDNYGTYADTRARESNMSQKQYEAKEAALVQRFLEAECDVIAVQEVLGKTEELAELALGRLALELRKRTNRNFEARVGPSNDPKARVGFLIANDRARVLNRVSYVNVELPKINEKQKQRFFSRGPLELQLEVQPRGESFVKTVTLITFHFKSKASMGGQDPTGLEFEPYRMEMSDALRRIVNSRHDKALAAGETILVLLGDRNSNFDSASARILEGSLFLSDFQGSAPCRLSKRGVPLCHPKTAKPQRLFSVLTMNPETKNLPGSIRYKGIYSWIDDIILPSESLPFAWKEANKEGTYASGVVYEPTEASDHALVWTKLNW